MGFSVSLWIEHHWNFLAESNFEKSFAKLTLILSFLIWIILTKDKKRIYEE